MTRACGPVLGALRDPADVASLSLGQWDDLLRRARNAGVLWRLAELIRRAGVEDTLSPKVQDHLLAARRLADHHRRCVRWEANRLHRALAPTGAQVVLLKGAAYILADLPPARGRLVSDVDILVPKRRLRAVEQALLAGGWEPMKLDLYDQRYYRTWMHELPPLQHRQRGSVVDVHHTILPESGRLHPDADALLAAARPVKGSGLYMLSPADMVLHGAVHLFQDGDLAGGLRDLIDLDDLLRHFGRGEPAFWRELAGRARRHRLQRPLYYALHFAQLILDAPVPPEVRRWARAGRPPWPTGPLMDRLATRALLGDEAPGRGWLAPTARFLLYARSHWLRMPPFLLAQHLTRKALRKWLPEKEE